MKLFSAVFILFIAFAGNAQTVSIIPQPQELLVKKGNFTITPATVILASDQMDAEIARQFNQHLKKQFGFELKTVKTAAQKFIRFSTKKMIRPGTNEKYELTVSGNSIEISGDTYSGTFYGMQTLIQLLPVATKKQAGFVYPSVPQLTVNDFPRFSYRGVHFDVARHFFSVEMVKRYIDYLAFHKLNTFHWHLTDDQGWRIEIKQFPRLTFIGSNRNGTIIGHYPGTGNDETPVGGYYTQAEVKEVIQYAKDRFIEVIPEIEMPGHGSAAIAAYPWLSCFPAKPTEIPLSMISKKSVEEQKNGRIKLVQETWGVFDDVFCAGNDSTFLFFERVLDEVAALFPSNYIHVGGDECPKTHWKQCPRCQQRMKDLHLKDEHELQSYFIQRIETYLNKKGKTIIGWDEILEGGLAPNAQVMSWRGEAGGIAAAKQQHYVIMTPGSPLYFDHSQSRNEDSITFGGYNPVQKIYAYDPVPKELTAAEAMYIRGAQANLWTEYITNTKKIEYMLLPRMAALSEILWTQKDKKDSAGFEQRLITQFRRYDRMQWNYSNAFYDLKTSILPTPDHNGVLWKVESRLPSTIWLSFNGGVSRWPYTKPQLITKSTKATAGYGFKNAGTTVTQEFEYSKSTGKEITLTNNASPSYPGDGAFTLVNGAVNEKGMMRTSEFLGFAGTDCEAVIDLGTETSIAFVKAGVFEEQGSWIWAPAAMQVSYSADGKNYSTAVTSNISYSNNQFICEFSKPVNARYVKIILSNKGIIPQGYPGAGNKAWLFVSELQVY